MVKSVGSYFFKKYHSNWGIWQIENLTNGMSAIFIKSVFSYEDAVKETYKMNGWGEPQRISRKY
jgi:hypothetical protein